PAPQAPFTVSQVNARARGLLEKSLGRIAVVGEVSGAKRGAGGHWYFSLKDPESQLPSVMFRREASRMRFRLDDGMEVVAHGRLTLYSAYGRYQMMVDRLEPLGAGALQAAFEQLKERLTREGLFAHERKRPLPRFPRRVAVVTSPTGAVIRDIIHVARRRNPKASILLVPTAVQGAESARSIARALERASRACGPMEIDAVIVGRGGGSLEDLWGFNDEKVARAIAACPVPVVSAVGHETDFTIADFSADVRAPTPSAAAELVFPVVSELRGALRRDLERGARAVQRHIQRDRHRISNARHRMGDARGALREFAQSLSLTRQRIDAAMHARLATERRRLNALERALEGRHPRSGLQTHRAALERVHSRNENAFRRLLEGRRSALSRLGARLHALSPLAVLERGYAIALDREGQAVRSASGVEVGDSVEVRLHRGRLRAEVRTVEDESDG
ncbi:MAG: exodeoxyribonuclease VII large subunit, partial [Myxococcota bacterium]